MDGETVTLLTPDGRAACEECVVAEAPLRRMKGLLGRDGLGPREGMLLRPAPSIHTWFMRFRIDVVFLDDDLTVLRVVEQLAPWRMARCRGARQVLELPAGAGRWRRIEPGMQLRLERGVSLRRAA